MSWSVLPRRVTSRANRMTAHSCGLKTYGAFVFRQGFELLATHAGLEGGVPVMVHFVLGAGTEAHGQDGEFT